jgi:hypothetical protein
MILVYIFCIPYGLYCITFLCNFGYVLYNERQRHRTNNLFMEVEDILDSSDEEMV